MSECSILPLWSQKQNHTAQWLPGSEQRPMGPRGRGADSSGTHQAPSLPPSLVRGAQAEASCGQSQLRSGSLQSSQLTARADSSVPPIALGLPGHCPGHVGLQGTPPPCPKAVPSKGGRLLPKHPSHTRAQAG